MTQSIEEQIGTLSPIEAKLHLFEIGRKMLRANSMPRSHDAALEKRESGFDSIGVDVSNDVHAAAVIDGLVAFDSSLLHCCGVRGSVVGHNHVYIFTDILADKFGEGAGLRVLCVEEPEIAIALADAEDYFFVVHLSDLPFAAIPAANIGSVQFHDAVQHRLIGLRHSVPDAVTEIPRCLVAHSDRALNLASGHSFLRFAEKVSSQKPLCKRQVRIIEHRAGSNRELIVAILAVEELFVCFQFDHRTVAAQAARAFRPAQANEQSAAFVLGREKAIYIN